MIALDLAIRSSGQAVRGVVALNAIFRRTEAARRRRCATRAGQLDGVRVPEIPSRPLTRWFGDRAVARTEACAGWLGSVDPKGYRARLSGVFASEDGPADAGSPIPQLSGPVHDRGEEPNSTPAMSERDGGPGAPEGRCRLLKGAAHMMPMTHAREVTTAIQAPLQGSACHEHCLIRAACAMPSVAS